MYVHTHQYKHTCGPVYTGVCEYMYVHIYAGTLVHMCAHVCVCTSKQAQPVCGSGSRPQRSRSFSADCVVLSPGLHSSLRCFLTAYRRCVFLSVQWLRLRFYRRGVDTIPGRGTKILYITWRSQKTYYVFSKYIVKNPYGHIGLSSTLLQCQFSSVQSLSRVQLFATP